MDNLQDTNKQQQEPVLCINPKVIDPATGKVRNGAGALTYSDTPCAGWALPLYTSPQPSKPWVSLTEEEVKHEWIVWRASAPRYVGFAKGIEAKLKDKNAQSSRPLTDEEIEMIYTGIRAVHHDIDSYVFARAIEAAHGIKEKNNG